MKDEYCAEDFARGVKNPYFDKLNRKVMVAVRHEDYLVFEGIAKINCVKPEVIMARCLKQYAKDLKEFK